MAKGTKVHLEVDVLELTREGLIAALAGGHDVVVRPVRVIISDSLGGVELCPETGCMYREKGGILLKRRLSGHLLLPVTALLPCKVKGKTPCAKGNRPSISWGA